MEVGWYKGYEGKFVVGDGMWFVFEVGWVVEFGVEFEVGFGFGIEEYVL